jgi:glycine C-acetyltransferase
MVTYPVIPKGMIILRLIPTATHTLEDVKYTIESFSKIVNKLKNGEYVSDTLAKVKVDL